MGKKKDLRVGTLLTVVCVIFAPSPIGLACFWYIKRLRVALAFVYAPLAATTLAPLVVPSEYFTVTYIASFGLGIWAMVFLYKSIDEYNQSVNEGFIR